MNNVREKCLVKEIETDSGTINAKFLSLKKDIST